MSFNFRLLSASGLVLLIVLPIFLLTVGPAIWAIPTRVPLEGSPADLGLKFESVNFPASDEPIELSAWWVEAEDPKAAVVVGHGVVSNKSFPGTTRMELLKRLVDNGYSVLALDHRGHGESEASGKLQQPYGAVLAYDFIGGIDFVRSRQAGLPVVIMGMSSSGTAAIYAAALDERASAAVVDCAAAEEKSILLQEIPRMTPVPGFLAPPLLWVAQHFYGLDLDMMRAIDAVGSISPRPILIIHTQDDHIVPIHHARELVAAGPSAELWVVNSPPVGTKAHEEYVEWRSHCRSYFVNPARYVDRLVNFLDRAVQQQPGAAKNRRGFSSSMLEVGLM